MSSCAIPPSPKPTKLGIDDLLVIKGEEFVLELIAKAIDGEAFDRAARAAVPHPYVLRNGCIWKTNVNHDGIPLDARLTTFAATITGEVVETNGVEELRLYQLEGQVNGRTKLFTVPASQFAALKWLAEHMGKEAVIIPRTEDREVAAAIQLLSPPETAVRTRRAHTGWLTHAGADVFLDSQGAIGSEGRIDGVEMALPPQLHKYVLEAPEGSSALQSAIRASLDITKVGPLEITVPLLAAAYGAPVDPAADSLFLWAGTGSFKSCLTALAAQHFGRGMDYLQLPGNFASTITALRELAFLAKDVLLAVDDFSKPDDHYEAQQIEQKAEALFRGVGNHSARSRASRDGSLRPAHPPRAVVISSGTQLPRAEDVKARMTIVRVHKNMIDLKALTRSQQDGAQGIFAQAMFGYVSWLARDRSKQVKWYHQRVLELREQFQDPELHPRTAPAMAAKLAALELFIEFAYQSDAINDEQANDYLEKFEKALKNLAKAQNLGRAAMQPAARFVRLLRDALASGRCHITTRNGEAPPLDLAAACGWKEWNPQAIPSMAPSVQGAAPSPSPSVRTPGRLESSGPAIGWIDGPDCEDLYLNPSESMAVVQKLSRDMQQPFNIGERDLHQYLLEDGFLVWDKKAKNEKKNRDTLTVRKGHLSTRLPVLHVWAKKVLRVDDDDDDDDE